MTDDHDIELRRLATRRADAKLGFRSHLIVYAIVNAGLAALNLVTSPGYLWFLWPMVGWGIGLFAHGASVYGFGGPDREDMIEQELERLKAQGNSRK